MRVFLLDSAPEMQGGCGLHFLGALFSRVAPAVFEIYRTRRMREEISALERASLARELHDGTLQILIALEVELEVLRKKSEQAGSGAGGQLEAIQQTLRDEIVNLRRLMQRYKRIDWGAGECVQALRCVAAQLESESGIATSFESDVDALHVPGQVRREILRIVQEALVNVRKHSGARSAKVQLTCSNGHYRIAIRDDGRGFGFEGRRTLLDLDAEGRGPEILKERVRLIGGELEIASVPGGGSCVEVRVPRGKVAAG